MEEVRESEVTEGQQEGNGENLDKAEVLLQIKSRENDKLNFLEKRERIEESEAVDMIERENPQKAILRRLGR